MSFTRDQLLPEPNLPSGAALLAEGRRLAQSVTVRPGPFLLTYGAPSEAASMPEDVSPALRGLGAFVCTRVEDLLAELVDAAAERNAQSD